MSAERTPEQWLALGDNLAAELAKVLTPGPWEHKSNELGDTIRCNKCFAECDEDSSDCAYHFHPCLVPDPIVIDWNTAMEWRDKAVKDYGRDIYLNIIRLIVAGDKKTNKFYVRRHSGPCPAQALLNRRRDGG